MEISLHYTINNSVLVKYKRNVKMNYFYFFFELVILRGFFFSVGQACKSSRATALRTLFTTAFCGSSFTKASSRTMKESMFSTVGDSKPPTKEIILLLQFTSTLLT